MLALHLPAVGDDFSLDNSLNAASAASIPDFMALWVPFILGTFKNPAVQPIKQPPGKVSLGMAWNPPSFKALAPYEILK